MELVLTIIEATANYRIGVIRLQDGCAIYTLELPYLDNQQKISSIPIGTYKCYWNGINLRLESVKNRTGIKIHMGNSLADTKGCILVGLHYTLENNIVRLSNSREAFGHLMSQTSKKFTLTIY